MYTPSDLEKMPKEFERLLSDAEMRIMDDIVRRIAINKEITRSADWQLFRLTQMGEQRKTIDDILKRTLDLSHSEIKHLYEDVIGEGYSRDEDLYKATGTEFIPFRKNLELQQAIKAVKSQTLDELKNITRTTGFATKVAGKTVFTPTAEYFQNILDGAMMDIETGAFDYNSTINRVIKEMTASGLRTVDYGTGWSNRVEVAARRAVMTGVSQVTGKINEIHAKELDTEYFEVSWHGTARPSHQEWQGKVFKKSELESKCGLGTVTGLCGANCRHSYYPFVKGVSKRTYTDKQLAKMNAKENEKKSFAGKEYTAYEATQRMRQMETQMRAQRQRIKLLESGNADNDDIITAKVKYQAISQQYVQFANAMDLPQERQRVYGDGLGRVGGGKGIAKTNPSDIIKERIKTSEYSTKLSKQQYYKHVEGTKQYNDYMRSRTAKGNTPQSIITIDAETVQDIINNYSGSGKVKVLNSGVISNVEFVTYSEIVGKYHNGTDWTNTKRFAIHYGKKGTHIVPVKEE
ncbi:phage minor capsid protein [Anaerosacchariphilus polymeriproducens]|uniref:phage minor capsid protein n=1 Tax=Anaerosacchariphilus polymeriproducens TaxID=1812858 RepID=UPI00138F9ED1|nr:phage minor capsid protein [Anaerosacchariphilus polymeriproducens]